MKARVRLFAILLLALTSLSLTAAAQSGTWAFTGPVTIGGSNASSTLMRDGRVLFAGGNYGGIGVASSNAQVYTSSTNTWAATRNMKSARNWPTGTLLPDGRVLVAGGSNGKLSGRQSGHAKDRGVVRSGGWNLHAFGGQDEDTACLSHGNSSAERQGVDGWRHECARSANSLGNVHEPGGTLRSGDGFIFFRGSDGRRALRPQRHPVAERQSAGCGWNGR